MKLYAYCVAERLDELAEPLHGISGAPVRLFKAQNLVVLVSDSDLDAVPVTREHALVHAAVIRSILDRSTPLPFRFGTLVTEQQLRDYCAARRSALETKVAHVRDCIEMSVKIIWDASTQAEEQPDISGKSAGASFLEEKRRQLMGDEMRAEGATQISKWLRATIGDLARDEVVTIRPGEKLVLAGAYLVERAKIVQYRERLAKARQDRPELHFLVSGPWPPYSFANIELEFKTQFGVS